MSMAYYTYLYRHQLVLCISIDIKSSDSIPILSISLSIDSISISIDSFSTEIICIRSCFDLHRFYLPRLPKYIEAV